MNQASVLGLLSSLQAIITNSHIVYTSGKHGDSYVNKDAIYPHTQSTSKLCRAIAESFQNENIDVVLAPALGAIILSQWVAFHLSEIKGREIFGVYAEKTAEGDHFVIKRGYDKLIAGKSVLIVEDVITTGGSVKKVVAAAVALGARIAGVAALCNRGGIEAKDLGPVPKFLSLVEVSLSAWDEKSCPLCDRKIPINLEVGKGREFLAQQGM